MLRAVLPKTKLEQAPPLDRRPEAVRLQVDDLLHRVRAGNVRIPPFQRPLMWDRPDKAELFDSIYRGYPVGTLLLWKRAAPAATVQLGALELKAPGRPEALWLVDGQQRVATLAEALLRKPDANELALVFDLAVRRFVWQRGGKDRTLPLSVVLDGAELGEWVVEARLSKNDRQLAFDVGKRIREYQVPAYVVLDPDEDVLRTIFHRTNATGKRLSEEDVFLALSGRKHKGKAPASLRDVARRSLRVGFGALKERDARTALEAVNKLAKGRDIPRALEGSASADALAQTSRALRKAVAFLQQDAGVPHVALLPCALPLAVLSKFFHLFREPRTRNRILLRRWLWRGSMREAIAGVRRHLACVLPGEEDRSVQRLLELAGKEQNPAAYEIDEFDFRSARSKLQCCALFTLEPCDLETGEPVSLKALFARRADHELPRVVERSGEGGSGLANRLLHPRISETRLRRVIFAASPAVLATHAIPKAAVAALGAGDEERFLALRGDRVRAVVERVFARRAEWGSDDSPPLPDDEDDEDHAGD
jgi:Protein of unknown function DUF262